MELEIPPGSFEGYIFDCDGTLADTMPLHYSAWCRAFRDFGATFHFGEQQFYAMGGMSTRLVVRELNEQHGLNLDIDALVHHKEECFLERLHEVRPIEPVVRFAREVAGAGRPVAVASGGFRHIVEKTLELVEIRGLFEIIMTPADVERGKPAPDMFLKAAELMGVRPECCLVFEDGGAGIEAARAAGMPVVVVPGPGSARAGVAQGTA
jgi:HAD superfamily hydrolase (TIGR01509 family)